MPVKLENLLQQVIQPFLQCSKPLAERKIILAFSGGLDSRVLLELLSKFGLKTPVKIKAVHVHHGLSANADRWAHSCQQWCDELNIELVVERVVLDTGQGESLEKIAREARYRVLAGHLNPGDILLTGQHADDQLETFLLALKRGSGPKGLSSMAQVMPFHQATLIRPLLMVRREQIHQYALGHHLQWVEDESNQDIRFERNFIRHQVTPVLTQRWPAFYQSVQRSAVLCARQEALLNELLQDKLTAALACDNSLSITMLNDVSDTARDHLLRMWLARLQLPMPSQVQLNHLWWQIALAQADANPKLQLHNSEIRRFAGRLYCIAQSQDVSDWKSTIVLGESLRLPDHLGRLSLQPNEESLSPTMGLNRQALTAQLSVVFNPQGLQACPVGRLGKKKLKKWFQEFAVPSWLRRRTPILLCGEQVAAVADLFVDRQFSGQDCELIWSKQREIVPEYGE